ncbi:hypothetical protein [Jeongeupia chitinilytica]|uniref:DUF3047 domain-containing protein n=1 Tax=Jeongeupia chitinilytica TaxID=1041641 RepID=A0ABQ3GZI0_9NEIS|nr:hypothetical protein [Jeongeupia chitinilytica]GHD62137.1 hypothetical protein GCM10007350_17630 [Jeongeupia chitinilytica]
MKPWPLLFVLLTAPPLAARADPVDVGAAPMPLGLSPLPGFASTFPPFVRDRVELDVPVSGWIRDKRGVPERWDEYAVPIVGDGWYAEYRYRNGEVTASAVRKHYECALSNRGFTRVELQQCDERCLGDKDGVDLRRIAGPAMRNVRPRPLPGYGIDYTIYVHPRLGVVLLGTGHSDDDPALVDVSLAIAQGPIGDLKPIARKLKASPTATELARADCPAGDKPAPQAVWPVREKPVPLKRAPFDLDILPGNPPFEQGKYLEHLRVDVPVSTPYFMPGKGIRADRLVPVAGNTWFYSYTLDDSAQWANDYYGDILARNGFRLVHAYRCDAGCQRADGPGPRRLRNYFGLMQSNLSSELRVNLVGPRTEYRIYSDRKTGIVIVGTEQRAGQPRTDVELYIAHGVVLDGSAFAAGTTEAGAVHEARSAGSEPR